VLIPDGMDMAELALRYILEQWPGAGVLVAAAKK